MSNVRTLNRSFAGGEISPEMYGRIDDAKYQAGAALISNFIATPQGPAENRPGFAYVNATKNNGVARLIPFSFSAEQTMVIEMGAGYFRFHTQGETLVYTPGSAWVAPSGAITISLSNPAIVTWASHGLVSGDVVTFYLYGSAVRADLPAGLEVGKLYTVDKIDANTFKILDNGTPVGLTATGGGVTTTYSGAGTANAGAQAGPYGSDDALSSVLSGLASAVPASGFATLNATIDTEVDVEGRGRGTVYFQYSTNGSTWTTFYSTSASLASRVVSAQVPVSNINLIQLRVEATASAPGDTRYLSPSAYAFGEITAWEAVVTTSGGGATTYGDVRGYRQYTSGDIVIYGGNNYSAVSTGPGGLTTPGTDEAVWHALAAGGTAPYEIKNTYAEADLFDIHYAQSADVITLVHPNYPPSELKRISATQWSFTQIQFTGTIAPPATVSIAASPGFLVVISSESGGTYTTASNHTLAYGDPVYVTAGGGTLASGFYMVSEIPVDGSGNPIKNQLKLMDYDGAAVSGTVSGSPTIQYGSKIFNITNYYVVTAISSDNITESQVSAEVSVLNNLNVTGSYNTITWSAVSNASRYYIYKKKNGLYGYIGETTGLTFSDNNIAPDFSITPPILDSVFTGAGEYPGAVSYFDQRRCFAGSDNQPQNVWMTRTGTESDFSYSLPTKDTDRIAFKVASREANTIRHIVPLTQLMLLTNSAELKVSTGSVESITPTNVSVRPQSYIGVSGVQPSIINNSLVYCAARGGHVREMGYQWQANGFVTGDISLRAVHLFDNLTIVDQCFAKCPRPIVWFVSSNGKLLGLTYIPEEQVGAWHQHTTDGYFESITAVSEGNEDRLYAVIRRTINGNTVRYIERMASRLFANLEDAFFVDAGSTYNGAPASTISGLTWLEGETVSILADGCVHPQKVVTGGSITLDRAASVVQVGLPYEFDIQTLPLVLQIDGAGQGRTKNINKVWVRVVRSSGVFAGYDADHLTEYKQRTDEAYGTPPDLRSDELEIVVTPSWQSSGQIYIHGKDPLPLSVVGITMQVAIGG